MRLLRAVRRGRLEAIVLGLLTLIAAEPVAAAQRQAAGSMVITGVVTDMTGAVLPDAQVELAGAGAAGPSIRTSVTDPAGIFRFEGVPQGRYDLRVTFEGFRPTTARVTVGSRPPGLVRVTLPLAGVKQEITVHSEGPQVNTASASNTDAVTVDQDMLESLPVFDQDYIATLSRFLDSGSIGSAGVTLVVNGMEVNSLNVSASAVQQIKINQDPYSAEYSRPGRGRIEILTKPGSQEYHGDANVIVRSASLNARNAFATVRPPEQRRIFEGFLGGPVAHGGKTSFTFSAEADADDQQAVVFAAGLTGPIRDTAPQPNRHVLLSGGLTHQRGDTMTMAVRPTYEDVTNNNRGIGGVTLASAGTNFEHREAQVTYMQQNVLTPALLHQFQVLVGQEREPTTNVSAARGLVVLGAFTGGGAQSDLLRTENHIQASESLTWTHGHHLVQSGVQLPDWSRRRFDDRTNFGGAFYFANLQAFRAEQPYAFIQQQGNGHLVLLEKVLGVYVKEDWQARSSLTVSFGLRYDWENYFHDDNNFAPRVALAYAPGNGKANVIRAGVGIFYDKTGPVPIADMLHFRPGGLRRVVLTDPSYPDPLVSASRFSSPPPSIVQFAPGIQIPYTLQYSAGLEHQLQKATTLAVTYIGSRGNDLFRSRDVNAPPPPLYLTRPNPAYGAVRQIESAGRQRADSMQISLRGKVSRWFNGQMQYTLSRTYNDTGGLSWFPANDYDLSGEYARADFDRRHRFLLLGRVTPGPLFDLGVGLSLQSGSPFTETLGQDLFTNGRGSARPPGVTRNSLEGGGYADLDLRLSRDLKFSKDTPQARALTLAIDAFNLLNRVNFVNYVGTINSPVFGQPVTARAPRQLQLSARIKF